MICKGSKEVSNTKHGAGEEGEWARAVSITEVAKQWYREVHRNLGGYGNDVDLKLGIMESR